MACPGPAAVLNDIIGDVYVKSGSVTLGANYSATSAFTSGKSVVVYGQDARVLLEPQSGGLVSPLDFRIHAGQVIDNRGFTSGASRLVIKGGVMLETGLLFGSMTIYLLGGTLIYNPETDPASHAPRFFIEGGTLDVRDSKFAIPTNLVIKGPNGTILGNAVDKEAGIFDIDLGADYP